MGQPIIKIRRSHLERYKEHSERHYYQCKSKTAFPEKRKRAFSPPDGLRKEGYYRQSGAMLNRARVVVRVLDLAFLASCSGFSIPTTRMGAMRVGAVDRLRGGRGGPGPRLSRPASSMSYSSLPSTAAEEGGDLDLQFTPVKAIGTIYEEARSFFGSHETLPREFRVKQLEGISRLVEENRDALAETIRRDLGQNAMFAEAFELSHIQPRAIHARENLPEWMEAQVGAGVDFELLSNSLIATSTAKAHAVAGQRECSGSF